MTTHAPVQPADLAQLVDTFASHPAAWLGALHFEPGERWWTRLHNDGLTEVWLLTWDQETATDLHDHGDSAGAFSVLTGSLEELRVDRDSGDVVATTLVAGETRSVERGIVHDVRNSSSGRAISIHAYSPPLEEMTYYERRTGSAPRAAVTVAADAFGQSA